VVRPPPLEATVKNFEVARLFELMADVLELIGEA
jgi:hypothetical protein